MYNLLVTAKADEWDEPYFEIELGRFLEYTDPLIAERFKGLNPNAIDELTKMPAIFAYELGVKGESRIGRLKGIRVRQGQARVNFEIDPGIRPFKSEDLSGHSWDFDLGKLELSRTHWAVKDVDLFEALNESGIVGPISPPESSRKFSRSTIVNASAVLKDLGHDPFDAMLIEFGIAGLEAGRSLGGLQARANALMKFALENSGALTVEGSSIGNAIVERAAAEEYRYSSSSWLTEDNNTPWGRFRSSLRNDGYTIENRKVTLAATLPQSHVAPSNVALIPDTAPQAANLSNTARTESPSSVDGLIVKPTVFAVSQSPPRDDLVSVMMPFDASFKGVYDAIKESCKMAGLECKRVDDVWEDSVIMQDVFDLIYRSRIVVVDFSTKNPNVFYEAGIAHTLGKHVVPISQSAEDVPFDLRHHRYQRYLNNGEGLEDLTEKLANRLRTLASR